MFFKFGKIKETIFAFSYKPEDDPYKAQFYPYTNLEERSQSKPTKAANLIAFIVVTSPITFLFMYLDHCVKSETLTGTGISAGILTIAYAFVYTFFFDYAKRIIIKKIPFHKLSPYFGSKLEETMLALKTKR